MTSDCFELKPDFKEKKRKKLLRTEQQANQPRVSAHASDNH